MIDAIAGFFGTLISLIFDLVNNLGLSIIILTLLIKLITFPLNNKQIQSAKNMQRLQPEIKKLQEKYKHDKEKQNQVVQAFMKENNMNPLAGCLPLLVQFPILIGLFRLLRDINNFPVMEGINPFLLPGAKLVNLVEASQIGFQNFYMPEVISQNYHIYIFALIAGITTFLYSKMSTASSADSSQKSMLYMMPVMITLISFTVPAGVAIYWIVNNLFSIVQHKFIMGRGTKEIVSAEDIIEEKPSKKKAVKKDEQETKEEKKEEEVDQSILNVFDEIEGKKGSDGGGPRGSKKRGKKGKGKK